MAFRTRRMKRVDLFHFEKTRRQRAARKSGHFLVLLLLTTLTCMMVVNGIIHWMRFNAPEVEMDRQQQVNFLTDEVADFRRGVAGVSRSKENQQSDLNKTDLVEQTPPVEKVETEQIDADRKEAMEEERKEVEEKDSGQSKASEVKFDANQAPPEADNKNETEILTFSRSELNLLTKDEFKSRYNKEALKLLSKSELKLLERPPPQPYKREHEDTLTFDKPTIRIGSTFDLDQKKYSNLNVDFIEAEVLHVESWEADAQAKHSRLHFSRRKENFEFKYDIDEELRNALCSPESALYDVYYIRDFGPECVALGDESTPIINSMKDLQTSWHKVPRPVKYRERKALFVELVDGGKNNPMHLLHNNMFPFVFYHLACYTGKEDVIGMLPPNLERYDWLNFFYREVLLSLFSGHTNNLEEFDSYPDMVCFPEVRYVRGAYKQLNWGPFLGMQCPLEFADNPRLVDECAEFAKLTIRFLSAVREQSIAGVEFPELKEPSRPLNVYVYDRMEQQSRRWKNANETMERLSEIPNVRVKYIPSFRVSIEDQCRFFHEADIFVMPHGGALANALCSRPQTAVVEIMKKCYTYDEWWLAPLADALHMNHVYTECMQPEKDSEEEYVSVENIFEVVKLLAKDVRSALGLA